MAREAADRNRLSRVLFIPAARPPHKSAGTHASYEDRYRMVEIACRADPRFEASRIEQGSEYSYSINTIERLQAELGDAGELYFLIGADAFAEIRTWHRWQDVVQAVAFIVVSRPGAIYEIPAGARVFRMDDLDLPVSSSEIRRKLAAGDTEVAAPPGVAAYIRQNGLYGAASSR